MRPVTSFPHGDRRRYRQGCRCSGCRHAVQAFLGNQAVPDDHLRVTCWCENTTVAVPAAVVRQGRTDTCGQAHCTEFYGKPASGQRAAS